MAKIKFSKPPPENPLRKALKAIEKLPTSPKSTKKSRNLELLSKLWDNIDDAIQTYVDRRYTVLYVTHLRLGGTCYVFAICERSYGHTEDKTPYEPIALFPYYRLQMKGVARLRAVCAAERLADLVELEDKAENYAEQPVTPLRPGPKIAKVLKHKRT